MAVSDKGCPVCEHRDLHELYSVQNIPVCVNTLADSRTNAEHAVTKNQHIVICAWCGFIFNCEFEPVDELYQPEYHSERGFSAFYRSHMENVINSIQETCQIKDKNILEVGCGHGEFLELLQKLAPRQLTGIDPAVTKSAQPYASRSRDSNDNIVFIRSCFDEEYVNGMRHSADILINRDMFCGMQHPLKTLKNFYNALATEGILYLETSSLEWKLGKNAFFDFPYEWCSYYSDVFLRNLLTAAGFAIIAMSETYNGQYYSICANKTKPSPLKPADGNEIRKIIESFASLKSAWAAAKAWSGDNERTYGHEGIYMWGASGKGVMCANMLNAWPVSGLIDSNPYKCGKFIPKTGHRVFCPSEISWPAVKTVIVINDTYLAEIGEAVSCIDSRTDVVPLHALF